MDYCVDSDPVVYQAAIEEFTLLGQEGNLPALQAWADAIEHRQLPRSCAPNVLVLILEFGRDVMAQIQGAGRKQSPKGIPGPVSRDRRTQAQDYAPEMLFGVESWGAVAEFPKP